MAMENVPNISHVLVEGQNTTNNVLPQWYAAGIHIREYLRVKNHSSAYNFSYNYKNNYRYIFKIFLLYRPV